MTKIQIDIKDNLLNKKLEMLKAERELKTKAKTVIYVLKEYFRVKE